MNAMPAPRTAPAAGPVNGSQAQYLTFRIGDEMFAIGILRIREIIEYQSPTRVPMMPPFVRGVLNLRGSVVPVVDLAARFGWNAAQVQRRSCIVIVEAGSEEHTQHLGIVVDGVSEVLEIAANQIEPSPSFGTPVSTDFIQGMARVGNGFVIVLDVDRTLRPEEMARLTRTV